MIDIRQNEDDWKVIVARLISAGYTIQRVADFLGVSYFVVYFLIRRIQRDIDNDVTVRRGRRRYRLELILPRKNGRKLPKSKLKEIRRLLVTTNLSPTEIARRLNIRNTYGIYKVRRELEARATRDAGGFQPERHNRTCPKHGRVSVWPCVACAAQGAKDAKRLVAQN